MLYFYSLFFLFFFFFNDTATTEIYTLSLHDALPIRCRGKPMPTPIRSSRTRPSRRRSEEHTSELQSHVNLVCRLLLEKKNTQPTTVLLVKQKTNLKRRHAYKQNE